ncbi:hypothetical protein EV2_045726 [Malus domestica]
MLMRTYQMANAQSKCANMAKQYRRLLGQPVALYRHLKNQIKHVPTMNTNAGVPGCLGKLALVVKIIALDGMQLRGMAEETDGIWVHMQTGAHSFIVFVRTQPRKKDGFNTIYYISHDHPNYVSPSTKFA